MSEGATMHRICPVDDVHGVRHWLGGASVTIATKHGKLIGRVGSPEYGMLVRYDGPWVERRSG